MFVATHSTDGWMRALSFPPMCLGNGLSVLGVRG